MEATVVCVDNSEWTRSGDYAPTRFQAQADAVNLLAGAKTQANPENTVGVLTMAGKSPRVLVAPTPDLGKILNSMQDLAVEGEANIASAVLIAQLALKHRQNKNQRQRIVLFVGSPLSVEKEYLVKIAKKLKKNNVGVDIVSFGNEETNDEKLEAFIEAVNSGDNSHLVSVPAGTVLADSLFGSPLFQGDGGGGYGGGQAGENGGAQPGGSYEFGVDPNLDPELAMALRVSLEEERARQAQPGDEAAPDGQAPPGEGAAAAPAPATAAAASGPQPMDEDALLQQALAMSMEVPGSELQQHESSMAPRANPDSSQVDAAETPAPAAQPAASAQPPQQQESPPSAPAEDVDMDEDLKAALQMSLLEQQPGEATPAPSSTMAATPAAPVKAPQAGGNPPPTTSVPQHTPGQSQEEYLASVLAHLPGVDPNAESVQQALRNLGQQSRPGSEQDKQEESKK